MNNTTKNNGYEHEQKELNKAKEYFQRREELKKQFPPISIEELSNILGLTIKEDNANKILTFLCCLSAYTDSSQFNISFNAPSSSGKSYIPLEISSLFPKEDVIELGYCTAQAFYHDVGEFDKEKKIHFINFERKIIVFLDQPSPEVLQRLRPILSHDRKEIHAKITDKTQKYGLKTKDVVIRGFASVIFCSASLNVDEQEATRFLLLSPETTQEKIKQGIKEAFKKERDFNDYQMQLKSNIVRQQLIERIEAIKKERITEIKIPNEAMVEEWFLNRPEYLQPRHQRDVKRLSSIIKIHTLLNAWHRETDDYNVITASDEDIKMGIRIWEEIAVSQELGLSPYVYKFFEEVIVHLYNEKQFGLTRKEVLRGHFRIYNRPLQEWKLRREILPMLETAGLITQEQDPNDKRCSLIIPVYPTEPSTILEENTVDQRVE